MQKIILFSLSFLASYLFYRFYSKYYKSFPKIRYRRVEVFPSIKITLSGRIIHLHHWFYFLIVLTVSIVYGEGIFASSITKGFLTGGIFQGITDPQRKLILKRETTSVKI